MLPVFRYLLFGLLCSAVTLIVTAIALLIYGFLFSVPLILLVSAALAFPLYRLLFRDFCEEHPQFPGAMAIFTAGFTLLSAMVLPEFPYRAEDTAACDLLEEAQRTGNHVVSGTPFTTAAPECRSGLPSISEKEISTCDPNQVAVVFVHGYNNTVDEVITKGNGLLALLRKSAEDAGSRICFFNFLWKGNVGPTAFRAAERSAMKSAPNLVKFVNDLKAGAHPPAAIILITHSLGARVALESLRDAKTVKPWIDCLLMVQPAVSWADLRKDRGGAWARWGSRVGDKELLPLGPGRYHESIRASGKIAVTQSSADCVLVDNFRTQHGQLQKSPGTMDLTYALGTPYAGKVNGRAPPVVHPDYREYDLSPPQITIGACRQKTTIPPCTPGEPVQIAEHSPLFDPACKRHEALSNFLWKEVLSPHFR